MLLFNSSLKSQNLIIILFCCIIWCEMTWVVYFIVNLCFHNFTMNPRIFKVPKYLYPTFFITKICQKLLFFLLLLKFINIALVNIREFSVQDIYMHIPSITKETLVCTEVAVAPYFCFPLSEEPYFLIQKSLTVYIAYSLILLVSP